MRRIRMIGAAVATVISLGAVASGALAAPSAQAQLVPLSHSQPMVTPDHAKPKPKPKTSRPLVGVNLYVNRRYSLAQAEAFGARDLKYIAKTLKLKAVSLAFDYNVPNKTSDTVNDSPTRTPTIADLTALTSIAKSYGLRVEYRVLFAVNRTDERGTSIRPKNLSAWLRSLLAAETPALKLAQREHISEFVAGTEMASIDQSSLWGGFFKKAAKVYHGILSYASYGGQDTPSGGGFFSSRAVRLPIEYFGASAYPWVKLPATASVARLTRAWVAFLRREPESVLRRTAIDELGIPAMAGAYRDPSEWNGLGHPKPDLAIQANWYKAACQAADLVHVRALYFWSAVLSSDPAGTRPSIEGFEGHPATEAAIRSCS